ncbi:glycosyl hydrolase family 71-domain-containing protein [Sordaria sp. MPI-SDFR-AT-0083]|nr:glycosyl hydrolase family 71-domain-containing protein [Sordaria sp. MPI-SDFR-AT-0083]
MWLFTLLAVLLGCAQVQAKAVFAHFMVENAKLWSVDQWKVDIRLAQAAHIDGFALNIRADDTTLGVSLSRAFEAADDLGFKMIFSFDYAGGGPWSSNLVISMILLYSGYDSYYIDKQGRPVVSTFEGPAQAGTWEYIIKKTNAAFIPDWSSLGAKAALEAAPCVPHGLFSWAPWPWGNTDGNTYVDASYMEFMEAAEKNCDMDMQYMMPASPWFYTNLPGYNKNWLWRGDDLWFDRWEQIRFMNPDYVEIISWNDYGESHHIGPLYIEGDSYEAFTVGKAPFNYALDMPHDGWRELLPFTIDLYKTGVATIKQEKLVAWYRVTPKNAACDDGWTTGNTASQLELEFTPQDVVQDKIFYSALLASSQPVTVTVGGVNVGATWTKTPSGGAGIYHGSVDFGGNTGAVVVTVGSMTINKRPITANCDDTNGYTNWNAFVASTAGAAVSATVNSTQWYGYCPVGACLCTKMGPGNKLPGPETPGFGTVGFPAKGRSASYGGLCSFACNYGYGCPNAYCDTVEHELVIPNVSPFTPDACTSGVGEGGLGGLCGFSCNFGFCPIHSCTCTSTGALHVPPGASDTITGKADPSVDERIYGPLCDFACSRGYCPEGVCIQSDVDDGNPYKDVNPAYIGPQVYETPTAACESPCVLVLPPSKLPATTTFRLPPYPTSFQVGSTTTTVTLYPADIVTDQVSFSNINITGAVTDGAVFPRCTSLKPDAIPVTLSYVSNAKTTVTVRQVELPPWPQITQGPPDQWTSTCGGWVTGTITNTNDDTDGPIAWIPPPTTTTTTPWPTYTGSFPPAIVEPIVDPIDVQCHNNRCLPEEDDDNEHSNHVVIKVKCDELWFFIFCIHTENIKVFGWKFTFPKAVIGPGPPPGLGELPEGWKFIDLPEFPPWPRITIGPDLTYPDKPTDCDNNKLEVPVEMYTKSYGLSVSNGATVTTTTKTITETAYETGCPIPEYTTTAACGLGNGKFKRQTALSDISPPVATAAPATTGHSPALVARNDDDDACDADWLIDLGDGCDEKWSAAIYFHDTASAAQIACVELQIGVTFLEYHHFKHDRLGTIFIYVENAPFSFLDKIGNMAGVDLWSMGKWKKDDDLETRSWGAGSEPTFNATNLRKRAFTNPSYDNINNWHRSMVSSYPGQEWSLGGDGHNMVYYHDGILGEGQYIYNFDEGVYSDEDINPASIQEFDYEYSINNGKGYSDYDHGTRVAQYAIGQSLGIAPGATLLVMKNPLTMNTDLAGGLEIDLIRLLAMIKDIEREGRQGKCVINISMGLFVPEGATGRWMPLYRMMIRYMETDLQCVVVIAAGNLESDRPQRYANEAVPARWALDSSLLDTIVVGFASKHGLRATGSLPWNINGRAKDTSMIFAPGLQLYDKTGDPYDGGSSFAAPMVAALVAYLRALPSPFAEDLKNPVFAGKMVKYLTRKVNVIDDLNVYDPQIEDIGNPRRIIWNGNVGVENCLVGYRTGFQSAEAQAVCKVVNEGIPEPGNTDNWTPDARHIDNNFPLNPSSSNGGAVTWHSGSVSPTCTANCGTLCTGYYCVPQPTGSPPDFSDPVNAVVTKTTSTTAKATTTKAITTMVTTTKATPTTTVQPLTRGPIHCHNEADFPDHNYINPKDQDDYAKQLKDIFELETIGPNGGFLMPINHNGGWLSYSGTWVDGCVTTVSRQNIYYPLGESNEVTAYMLMRDNYVLCNNGGCGGWTQAGCVKYDFSCTYREG